MPKVLITGGTGFVGHWMRQTQPAGLDCTYLSSLDYRLWYWHTLAWDYVVHLAPVAPARAIEAAKGGRLLYASSGIVYHPENDNEYRRNKMQWEQECLDSGADVVIARLFTFCGERLSPDHAIVAFEQAAKEGKPLHIWGDGSCVRSYMHGAEMARWLWAILLRGKLGEVYDVGSDKPVTMLELARSFSNNIIIEGGRDAMPCYLPTDTEKTRKLLDV
jgi:Nucleoside-diphosphate-sugar epimerases